MACSGITEQLIQGCCTGSMSYVEQALREGAYVDGSDELERTPLTISCKTGNQEMVKILLMLGANVNARDCRGRSALMAACHHNHHTIVRLLLRHGAKPDRESMLEFACRQGYEDIVISLLKKEVSRHDGIKALIWACENSRGKMLALLLQHGVKLDNIERRMYMDITFLGKVYDLYRDRGIRLFGSCEGIDGVARTIVSLFDKKDKMLELLLQHRAIDVNARGENETTALIFAAESKKVKIIPSLLQHGADVNAMDVNRTTPLLSLCKSSNCDADIVELLLRNGANVDAIDINGMTPLLMLCTSENCDAQIIELLLSKGADVNASDKKGVTPLLSLCKSKNCDAQVIELLLRNGADINASNVYGMTPLLILCKSGNDKAELVELLLRHCANVNDQCKTKKSPIIWAVEVGSLGCVEKLLAAGANLDLTDNQGCTVLSYALSKRSSECLKLLLVDGKLLNEGKLKPVHKNLNYHAKSKDSLLCAIEHRIFEWEWCCFIGGRYSFSAPLKCKDADNLIFAAFNAGFCPGEFNCSNKQISPLIYYFFCDDTETINILLEHLYYFPEDIETLSTYSNITTRIENTPLLQQITRQPPSLETWSFLTVSKAISLAGPPGLRGQRVESLPIPDKFKKKLKFSLDYSEPRINPWRERVFEESDKELELAAVSELELAAVSDYEYEFYDGFDFYNGYDFYDEFESSFDYDRHYLV